MPDDGIDLRHTLAQTYDQTDERDTYKAILDLRIYDTKHLISDAREGTQDLDISSVSRPRTVLFESRSLAGYRRVTYLVRRLHLTAPWMSFRGDEDRGQHGHVSSINAQKNKTTQKWHNIIRS